MPPAATRSLFVLALAVISGLTALRSATPPASTPAGDIRAMDTPPGRGPRGPFGPGPGLGGGPPFGADSTTPLVSKFDANKNGRLDTAERSAARAYLAAEIAAGRGPRRPGPPGGGGGGRSGRRGGPGAATQPTPAQPGPKLSPQDIPTFPNAPLFDPATLRTLFLDFETADWESELSEFYRTDVEVPAKLTVDGQVYPDVGVHFRGASSFFTVGPGHKRSLNLSLDHAHKKQRWMGVKTLNLLNSHTDPTFLRSMLYYHVAREYLPAPRANLVRLVINGETWGIYVSAEQVNAEFAQDRFKSPQVNRWKAPGSPRGRATLAYLGDNPDDYRRIYSLKSKENPKAWTDLIRLCRTLSETPTDQLQAHLAPLLDLDGALRFLALENVFINNDGYWIRTSDYHLIQSPDGRFHLLPHDANETFRGVESFRGFGGGRGGGGPRPQGAELSPLSGSDDPAKPLLSKLLAVPSLRQRYLEHVRHMSAMWLDWNRLGPVVSRWHQLIDTDVRSDARKLYSYEAFQNGLAAPTGTSREMSLKSFADQRRAYLAQELERLGLPKS